MINGELIIDSFAGGKDIEQNRQGDKKICAGCT